MLAWRIGQLVNSSDLAKNLGVDTTTVQRWIKTPKIYFLDIGLAVRLQGWTQFLPILSSPMLGSFYENIILIEIHRFLINTLTLGRIFFLRNKEKTEIDFLVSLPNQSWIAIELKYTVEDYSAQQLELLTKSNLPILDRWVVAEGSRLKQMKSGKVLSGFELFSKLAKVSDGN